MSVPGASRRQDSDKIETILSAYREATEDLLAALKGGDGDAVARAFEARESGIEAYSSAVEGRNRAARSPDGALRDLVRWHHIRISELESEIHRLLKGFQDEVERELGRIRKGRKTRDAYAASPYATARIVNGEG